jgi:hypothetical protein
MFSADATVRIVAALRECARRRPVPGTQTTSRHLDGLRRALAHERKHRVTCVPEQRDATDRPARHRRAIEQRPDERLVDCPDDLAHLRVPTLESGEGVGDLATVSP